MDIFLNMCPSPMGSTSCRVRRASMFSTLLLSAPPGLTPAQLDGSLACIESARDCRRIAIKGADISSFRLKNGKYAATKRYASVSVSAGATFAARRAGT